MNIGLFVPCYIDQFYPQVGIASLRLLERLGCVVDYPLEQTCCGQPLANSGMEQDAKEIYHHFVDVFSDFDVVVVPSASCALHVSHHYDVIPQTQAVKKLRKNTYDICSYLIDVLKVEKLDARFPFRVGLHQSCHGLRGLRMAKSSELVSAPFSKWNMLLNMVEGIELINLTRPDECCGFGGTFSVTEEAVSVKMGKDRIDDHLAHGAQYITSGDMSCLMHLEGILRRNKSEVKVKHIVEILNRV